MYFLICNRLKSLYNFYGIDYLKVILFIAVLMTTKSSRVFIELFFKRQFLGLLGLQISLGIVIFVSLAVAGLRYQRTVFPAMDRKSSSKNQPNLSDRLLPKEIKPLNFYTELLAVRDIFNFGTAKTSIEAVSSGTSSSAGANFVTRYIVQGIVFDKNSQVIIKDTQSTKTYFVHRNEILDGATLVDISGNRVIFDLAGETVELIKK